MKYKTALKIALAFLTGFTLLTTWHYVSECYIFHRETMPIRYYAIKAIVPVSFTFICVSIAASLRARKARRQDGEQPDV